MPKSIEIYELQLGPASKNCSVRTKCQQLNNWWSKERKNVCNIRSTTPLPLRARGLTVWRKILGMMECRTLTLHSRRQNLPKKQAKANGNAKKRKASEGSESIPRKPPQNHRIQRTDFETMIRLSKAVF